MVLVIVALYACIVVICRSTGRAPSEVTCRDLVAQEELRYECVVSLYKSHMHGKSP